MSYFGVPKVAYKFFNLLRPNKSLQRPKQVIKEVKGNLNDLKSLMTYWFPNEFIMYNSFLSKNMSVGWDLESSSEYLLLVTFWIIVTCKPLLRAKISERK